MRSFDEYCMKMYSMKPNIYIDGRCVGRDDKRLAPGIKTLGATYRLAEEPSWKNLIITKSHLDGVEINRFCHVNQSMDDLLMKQKMIRLLCRVVGGCIQRCMGCDAINALSIATYYADMEYGTDYHKRFIDFLRVFQREDLTAACAQTDVKGHRRLRPHQQADPDLYVRVVEKRSDGIVVRGAKNCITMAAYSDMIIVIPTRRMTDEDRDWSVAFYLPADWKGIKLVTRATGMRPRRHFKAPIAEMGAADSFIIFDDVFVPWDNVFLCGESNYATLLAWLFALYHRHSYTGCKPGFTDIMMGASALVADYNGVGDASHVRSKLAEMASTAELVYAAGVASAVYGRKTDAGTYAPNEVYVNVGRRHAGLHIYEEYDMLADLAGGLAATLPYEGDFLNPELAELLNKYIKRRPEVSSEDVHRCFRMVSDLLCSALSGVFAVAGVHGGGSPVMEEIAIWRSYDFEERMKLAKYLAGVEKDYLPKELAAQ